MEIGMIGLGKLGLPVATAIAHKGHFVVGHDIDKSRMAKVPQRYLELDRAKDKHFNHELASAHTLSFGSLIQAVKDKDIVFISVQTPHSERFEGVNRLPIERKDFNYTFLIDAVKEIDKYLEPDTIVAIISTVLPGTIRDVILPLTKDCCQYVYNPSFIAMGTTMYDFLHPEMHLLGGDSPKALSKMAEFYDSITDAPVSLMSFESAELTKVCYNTFITMKIIFANTVMELCEKFPTADVDSVTGALQEARDRIVSPAYMDGGMGDGGGCHPRDNIALSWLAKKVGLSYDLFEEMMTARDKHTEMLVDIIARWKKIKDLRVTLLGYAFKPGTNITTGSPALLLASMLRERNIKFGMFDPIIWKQDAVNLPIDPYPIVFDNPGIFFIGCKHEELREVRFEPGSVVIDPFRFIDSQKGVILHSIGGGGIS